MIYGYARVSTKIQDKYGNSIQDQIARLTAAGCSEIYKDSFTGTKMDRPGFNELMSVLQPGDTLVVTKLDRFARTASDGAKMVQQLVERGIEVIILNMGKADNTPMGKLMIQVMFAFAEFERDMIVERTAAGKAVAKANDPNWKEGRKRKDVSGIAELYEKHVAGEMTIAQCCEELGISKPTWHRRIRELRNGFV